MPVPQLHPQMTSYSTKQGADPCALRRLSMVRVRFSCRSPHRDSTLIEEAGKEMLVNHVMGAAAQKLKDSSMLPVRRNDHTSIFKETPLEVRASGRIKQVRSFV